MYKNTMTHEDYYQIVPDYVLGLLPASRQGDLEGHLQNCILCRDAVSRERKMTRLIRASIQKSANPEPLRLQNLMPAPPKKHWWGSIRLGWQTQLAPLALIMLFIFGGILMKTPVNLKSNPLLIATTNLATATSTQTPTATLPQTTTQQLNEEPFNTNSGQAIVQVVIAQSPGPIPSINTPAPQPTPMVVEQDM